jgi:hypothetical protein
MRMFSWLASQELGVMAFHKGERSLILATLLEPPSPPWGVSIADSGQKHLLYQGAVNVSPHPPYTVTLEGARVVYDPASLARDMEVATRIVAGCGKPALPDGPTLRALASLSDYWPSSWEAMAQEWGERHGRPSWALACWLCPSMEESREQHAGEAA